MTSRTFEFDLLARCAHTGARQGRLRTPHGDVATPAFMPVGTRGTVKGVTPDQLCRVGAQMVLANTYHLHLRPGEETVAALGGLHGFMGWDGPILTDSGGYQIFSLAEIVDLDDDGATIVSVVDGSKVRLTPEKAIDVQRELGADVVMALDQCPTDANNRSAVEVATTRTSRWLERCVRRWRGNGGEAGGQALFGIVQGGVFADLRSAAVDRALPLELPGYAIGGVSLGENREAVRAAVEHTAPLLPADRPRYLMGVGTPLDFFDAIERGIDLFDCVTPTRHGRNHRAFTSGGQINLRNLRWARDDSPLEEGCDCPTCERHSRGYLRHLCKSGEMLAGVLLTLHNLRHFHRLLERIRAAIPTGDLPRLRERVLTAEAPAG